MCREMTLSDRSDFKLVFLHDDSYMSETFEFLQFALNINRLYKDKIGQITFLYTKNSSLSGNEASMSQESLERLA